MAFLSEENQREIKTIFEHLDHDVHLEFFTERESPIIIPGGGNCPTCKDTGLLLQEVVALSDKLHLDVNDVTTNGEAASQHGIERIPAFIMSAEGVQGKIRYFGLPSGYEFAVLIGSLLDVSKADADLADETNEVLSKLDKDVHIQVFVTPTWPHCPEVARLAHRMAIANLHVVADVVEVSEFPDLANRYAVRGVPKIVINETVQFVGNVPEAVFRKHLEDAVSAG